METKLLCVNLGKGGGCVYYANHILRNLNVPKEIWIAKNAQEVGIVPDVEVWYAGCRMRYMLFPLFFILPFYLIRIIVGICRHKYDKIIVFGPHIWDFLFLWVFRLMRKKSYYVVHDGIMHTGESLMVLQKEIIGSMKLADHLIYLSDYTRLHVKEKLNINKPFCIVPHGVITYDAVSEKITFLRPKPRFLMVGRINYYKGIDLLTEMIRECDLSMTGGITIAGKQGNNVTIPTDVAARQDVQIVDKWLTPEELDSYVRACDILLMPYLEASQSGVAALSIGYKKPAIVTCVGAIREQLRDAAYYMDEISSQALYRAIKNACEYPEAYIEKQKELQLLASKYTWQNLAAILQGYFENQ